MIDVINNWGEIIRKDLEMSDIVIGNTYRANKYVCPQYLENSSLVAVSKGKKNIKLTCDEYPGEYFYLMPFMLNVMKGETDV